LDHRLSGLFTNAVEAISDTTNAILSIGIIYPAAEGVGVGGGEQGQEPYPSLYPYVSTDLANVQTLRDFLEGKTNKKVNWDQYTNASTGGKNYFVYIRDRLHYSKDDFKSYNCNSTESDGYMKALDTATEASAERAEKQLPVLIDLDMTNLFF
jgi:hypothetical protein